MLDYSKVADGMALAAQIHGKTYRKAAVLDEVPTMAHLWMVATYLIETGADTDEIIAGLLHDAIEDGPANARERIQETGGSSVLVLVGACTEMGTGGGEPKLLWRPRKTAYIANIATLGVSPLRIIAADKLANCITLRMKVRAVKDEAYRCFIKEYPELEQKKEASLWFYRSCLDALWSRWTELQEVVSPGKERRLHQGLQVLLRELDEVVQWLENPLLDS